MAASDDDVNRLVLAAQQDSGASSRVLAMLDALEVDGLLKAIGRLAASGVIGGYLDGVRAAAQARLDLKLTEGQVGAMATLEEEIKLLNASSSFLAKVMIGLGAVQILVGALQLWVALKGS